MRSSCTSKVLKKKTMVVTSAVCCPFVWGKWFNLFLWRLSMCKTSLQPLWQTKSGNQSRSEYQKLHSFFKSFACGRSRLSPFTIIQMKTFHHDQPTEGAFLLRFVIKSLTDTFPTMHARDATGAQKESNEWNCTVVTNPEPKLYAIQLTGSTNW